MAPLQAHRLGRPRGGWLSLVAVCSQRALSKLIVLQVEDFCSILNQDTHSQYSLPLTGR